MGHCCFTPKWWTSARSDSAALTCMAWLDLGETALLQLHAPGWLGLPTPKVSNKGRTAIPYFAGQLATLSVTALQCKSDRNAKMRNFQQTHLLRERQDCQQPQQGQYPWLLCPDLVQKQILKQWLQHFWISTLQVCLQTPSTQLWLYASSYPQGVAYFKVIYVKDEWEFKFTST